MTYTVSSAWDVKLYYTIPYHTIPYHTVPYHTIPYRTVKRNYAASIRTLDLPVPHIDLSLHLSAQRDSVTYVHERQHISAKVEVFKTLVMTCTYGTERDGETER